MSALAWALALLLPIGLGWALVRCLAPDASRALALALGAALGPPLTSLLHVGWLAALGPPGLGEVVVEAFALAALVVVARRRGALVAAAPPPAPWTPLERALGAALALIALAFVASFVAHTLASPHGGWDAWAIWNLRARTLARGGGDWSLVSGGVSLVDHLDYPLAVPGAAARAWGLAGESALAPALLALQAALAGAAVVGAALAQVRGRAAGLLGAAVVLAAPTWAGQAAAQGGDVPLAALLVAALALLARAEAAASTSPTTGPLVLAGVAAGLCAWTKNEGLVAAVSVVAAAALVDTRARARGAALALLGAAPGLLAFALHHAAAPVNDLVAGQGAATAGKLLDAGRWAQALRGLGGAALGLWPAAPLGLFVVVAGLRAPPRPRAAALGAAVIGVQLAAYALAYVTTPWDLAWHLTTSRERVVLHAWPALVLVALLVVRAPRDQET